MCIKRTQLCDQQLVSSHLVIEVVERGLVFRKMAEVTFRKIPHPQLIPEEEQRQPDDNKCSQYAVWKYISEIYGYICFRTP